MSKKSKKYLKQKKPPKKLRAKPRQLNTPRAVAEDMVAGARLRKSLSEREAKIKTQKPALLGTPDRAPPTRPPRPTGMAWSTPRGTSTTTKPRRGHPKACP